MSGRAELAASYLSTAIECERIAEQCEREARDIRRASYERVAAAKEARYAREAAADWFREACLEELRK